MGCKKHRTVSEVGRMYLKIIAIFVTQISLTVGLKYLNPVSYPGRVSLGVYKEELKNSLVFYETFVPLIYEYRVPVYKTLDITLRDWRARCENDSFAPSYTCPVFFHFEKFLERLEAEVVPQAWVGIDPLTNKSITISSGLRTDADDFCSRIQRHFKGSFSKQFEFEKYVELLGKCPIGELRIERAIDDYVYNFKALFKKMNDNYEAEFSNKFFGETNKKTGPAFYVNAVATHQNGLMLAYWMEKTRWMSAQTACNEQRIPAFLLKAENISKSLGNLDRKLVIGKQTTSIPIEEISTLYKLPLADCSFIETSGNFVVTVLIPVKRNSSQPKIYTLRSIPFTFVDNENNRGKNSEVKICQMKPITGRYLFDKANGQLQTTQCDPTSSSSESTLCQVKEGTKDPVMDLCVRSIFADSVQGVKRHCYFDCFSIQNDTFGLMTLSPPPIQQVASDTWVASTIPFNKTGSDSVGGSEISIKCEGNTEELKLDLSKILSGALEIKLPCRCHIVFQLEVFYVQAPCERRLDIEPLVRQIVPVHFLKDDVLAKVKADDSPFVLNSTFLDEQLLVPQILQSAQRLEGSVAVGAMESTKDASVVSTLSTSSRSSTNEGGAQLGVLWTLVILQLIIVTVLIAFAAYKYVKYRNAMSYSKERLVYNIYASPSDTNIAEPSRVISDNMNPYE